MLSMPSGGDAARPICNDGALSLSLDSQKTVVSPEEAEEQSETIRRRSATQPTSGGLPLPANASPSLTHSQSSSVSRIDALRKGVGSRDWLSGAGCGTWDKERSTAFFSRVEELKRKHGNAKTDIFYDGLDIPALLSPRGIGFGNVAHLEVVLYFNGMMLAVSPRDSDSRQLWNFQYKIPGEPCVVHGADECFDYVFQVLGEIGFTVTDDWISRMDLTFDVADYDMNDFPVTAFTEGRFLTTAKKWTLHDGTKGKTGYTIGGGNRISFTCYNKLEEAFRKHKDDYVKAMIDKRWGGRIPDSATRFEYRLMRNYLADHGINRGSDAFMHLPGLIGKITSSGPYPFFVITDKVPDRKGKHQSLVNPDPEWLAFVNAFQAWTGEEAKPLPSKVRVDVCDIRAFERICGSLTSIAARNDRKVNGKHDLFELFLEMCTTYKKSDSDVKKNFELKRRKLHSFPLKSNPNYYPEPDGRNPGEGVWE